MCILIIFAYSICSYASIYILALGCFQDTVGRTSKEVFGMTPITPMSYGILWLFKLQWNVPCVHASSQNG